MANTVIALKKSAVPSSAPTSLANGELAINYADGKLFYKSNTGVIKSFVSDLPAVADSFGSVNAAGTLIVSDTSGDVLNIVAGQNVTITGNTLTDTITISATGNVTTADITAVYNHANAAYDTANASYTKANNALANTTGTLDGTLTISNSLIVLANSKTNGHMSIGSSANVDSLFAIENTPAFAQNFPIILTIGENLSGNLSGARIAESIRTGYTHTGTTSASMFDFTDEQYISNTSTGPIGTLSSSYVRSYNYGSGTVGVMAADYTVASNYGSGTISFMSGAFNRSFNYGNSAITAMAGTYATTLHAGSGTVGTMYGQYASITHSGPGLISSSQGFTLIGPALSNTGNITTSAGVLISSPTATGTGKIVGTAYGVRIRNQNTPAVLVGTPVYNFYSEGANNTNIFDGTIGVGLISPTAKVAVANGTSRSDVHIYGTYTDASNYERLNITANTTGHYIIGEEAGTGSGRSLYLGANNGINMTIDTSGYIGTNISVPASRFDVFTGIGTGAAGSANNFTLRHSQTNGNAMVLNMGVSNGAKGGSNQGHAYLQAAYWGGSENNPLVLQPLGGGVLLGDNITHDWKMTVRGTLALAANTNTAGAYGGRLAFPSQGYAGETAWIASVFDAAGFSGGTALAFGTIAGADVASSDGVERLRISSSGNVGVGTTNPTYKLEVAGSFAAQTKSFVINHESKPGYKLRHGSLEGPENGVYVRGKATTKIIELPDYWSWLVDEETITVTLTPIGKFQELYVEKIEDNKVYIKNAAGGRSKINCFYMVNAERKDVEKMEVEIKA